MIDSIDVGGGAYCHIVRARTRSDETCFFTPPDADLQVGLVIHGRGHEIPRHEHHRVVRQLIGTGEVLLVQRGRCEIDFYDQNRVCVATRELGVGDIAILLGGGHGLRMLEDTVLLEVKQGPYGGVGEKILF
jgi:hypothetical protein